MERPMLVAIRGALRSLAIFAALLLVPAGLIGGVWLWPRGLAFVAAYVAINLAGDLALARWRPDHYRVRQQSVVAPQERRQPRLDAIGAVGLLVFGAAWLAFIPMDVFRLHLLPSPGPIATAFGGAAVLIGAALSPLAVWENRYATPNVQDQSGEEQRVVDTGVYALLRHPIYLANLLWAPGGAVWLGSWAAALGGGAVLLAMTIGRIVIEERHLNAHVAGYADYARRVRARLIPFVI
jgi:protein-S-isoprenylcysteine O-methyltransferase Ste14